MSKRFSNHCQFPVSYAFQKELGESVWDDSNYMAGYGQHIPHHNLSVSGNKNAQGAAIGPQLALPSDYQFGDPTITQDFRLTKVFTFRERYKLSVLGEMFNAFNIANLTGYSFQLDAKAASAAAQTFAFGQPNQRINQTFGSAGARAVQVGARITF